MKISDTMVTPTNIYPSAIKYTKVRNPLLISDVPGINTKLWQYTSIFEYSSTNPLAEFIYMCFL